MFAEGDGETVALRPAPGGQPLRALRERLGLDWRGGALSPRENVRASLATLKDVAGITGSFVCTQSGRLVAREIPPLFEDAVLAEAGSRLVRVGETFAAVGDELEMAVIRYGDHKPLSQVAGGRACSASSSPARSTCRRCEWPPTWSAVASAPAVARVRDEPPPAPPPDKPQLNEPPPVRATPTIPAHATEGFPGMRRFRGRAVD